MRASLSNLPPDINNDYFNNCARSASSSEVSEVQSQQKSACSTNSLDILVVDQNEID